MFPLKDAHVHRLDVTAIATTLNLVRPDPKEPKHIDNQAATPVQHHLPLTAHPHHPVTDVAHPDPVRLTTTTHMLDLDLVVLGTTTISQTTATTGLDGILMTTDLQETEGTGIEVRVTATVNETVTERPAKAESDHRSRSVGTFVAKQIGNLFAQGAK
ncbi:hypothetical protein K491DRAFT_709818 [Lophiostoma macrostomum CBS 122681]|uniref:Uncharacterized protein n=1 Tax=Lophiostoma macrostomum CBS 122681 TaxID=1314788 RepID=A0A6A6TV03_9PLEO|nr:hypothetical protein K491DRAFT_709818 [Lophiostoma macrostomum CBS 122681]